MLYAMKLDRAEITGLSIQENRTRGLGPKQFGKEMYLTKLAVRAKNLKVYLTAAPGIPGI